jgi:hypothetical protein
MQGASQQPTFRQQGIDGRDPDRNGHPTGSLGTMGTLKPADLFAQGRRDLSLRQVGGRGSKGIRGNDGHCPLGSFFHWLR